MSNFQGDIELERLANDSMQDWGDDFDPETVEQHVMEEHDEAQRDYPERFNSREEWDAYNEECDRHDLERAHLKGNDIDFGDLFDLSFWEHDDEREQPTTTKDGVLQDSTRL